MYRKYKICSIFYFYIKISICFIHVKVSNSLIEKPQFDVTQYFNTKTPYSYGHNGEIPLADEGCIPKQIWLMIRHGSRNPGKEMIEEIHDKIPKFKSQILENFKHGKGSLSESVIDSLRNWTFGPHFTLSDQKKLNQIGESELFGIGQRYKKRFQSIFQKPFSNITFQMKYTDTQRCKQSAKSFFKGIFDQEDEIFSGTQLGNDQEVIRFYKGCKRWIEQVKTNSRVRIELEKFEKSIPVSKMLEKIQTKLGFDVPIAFSKLEIIYQTCIFDKVQANDNSRTPWCNLFDENDLKIMDYHQDIKHFFESGYGYEINYQLGCPMIRDFIQYFTEKIKNPQNPVENISYFTHSGAILKLVSTIGLFRDPQPINSDNFDKLINSRLWKMSVIDQMASNIAFILYNCNGEFKVGQLFQEKPLNSQACPHQWLCPFDKIKTHFTEILKACDIEEMCKT